MTFLIKLPFVCLLLSISHFFNFSSDPAELPDTVPTPVCRPVVAADISPLVPPRDVNGDGDLDGAAVTLAAQDLIDSLILDGDPGPLTYSINWVEDEADPTQDTFYFPCPVDLSFLVQVWVWDEAGNGASCETFVLVNYSDVILDCTSDPFQFGGLIITEGAQAVPGVQVNLNGSSLQSINTNSNGYFLLTNFEPGGDYSVVPELDTEPLNGISTFDLVLISKHVLGLQPLDSPYKMIAADVDRSESITVGDVLALRRLLLNIDTEFENNTSWRFIPQEYDFSDPADPWTAPIPEMINFDPEGEQIALNFIAVKTGDVNLDASLE